MFLDFRYAYIKYLDCKLGQANQFMANGYNTVNMFFNQMCKNTSGKIMDLKLHWKNLRGKCYFPVPLKCKEDNRLKIFLNSKFIRVNNIGLSDMEI